eukprot:6487006-Prymnesium_polylepis.2
MDLLQIEHEPWEPAGAHVRACVAQNADCAPIAIVGAARTRADREQRVRVVLVPVVHRMEKCRVARRRCRWWRRHWRQRRRLWRGPRLRGLPWVASNAATPAFEPVVWHVVEPIGVAVGASHHEITAVCQGVAAKPAALGAPHLRIRLKIAAGRTCRRCSRHIARCGIAPIVGELPSLGRRVDRGEGRVGGRDVVGGLLGAVHGERRARSTRRTDSPLLRAVDEVGLTFINEHLLAP